jgi:hypothetical protein
MRDIGAVEPVQSGRRVVAPRDAVTGRTVRASATDRREVAAHDIVDVEPRRLESNVAVLTYISCVIQANLLVACICPQKIMPIGTLTGMWLASILLFC